MVCVLPDPVAPYANTVADHPCTAMRKCESLGFETGRQKMALKRQMPNPNVVLKSRFATETSLYPARGGKAADYEIRVAQAPELQPPARTGT
jgi:hypothetical protein